MHYARCSTCRSELSRKSYSEPWLHIHGHVRDHIGIPAEGSILKVEKVDEHKR